MKRTAWIFCFLFFLGQILYAQADSTHYVYRPRLAVKLVPLPLIDYTPALQFAVEARTFRHQAIQLEYGYLMDYTGSDDGLFSGFKLKSEYRFYNPWGESAFVENFFVGFQYLRKHVDTEGIATVWRAGQNFQQNLPITVSNRTNSYYIVLGTLFPINQRVCFELATGVGSRDLSVRVENLPDDAFFDANLLRDNFFNPVNREGNYRFLTYFLSMKLNFIIFE